MELILRKGDIFKLVVVLLVILAAHPKEGFSLLIEESSDLMGVSNELKLNIFKYLTIVDLNELTKLDRRLVPLVQSKDLRKICANNWLQALGIRKVSLPGGVYQMGSPGDEEGRFPDEVQRWVKVDSFDVAATKITRAQWKQVMSSDPIGADEISDWVDCPDCPVTHVSWYDAQDFIQQLKAMSVCARLPLEVEQEYYMRVGFFGDFSVQTTGRPWGTDDLNETGKYSWNYNNCRRHGNYSKTHSVGTNEVPSNSYGMMDVMGNALEWSQDVYEKYEVPEGNSFSPPWIAKISDNLLSDQDRVLRGCSWGHNPLHCRSARRVRANPKFGLDFASIRIVFCDE